MSKPVIALAVATLVCGSASAYLWKELRTERAQAQRLQARVSELERARLAPPPDHVIPTSVPETIAEVPAESKQPRPSAAPAIAQQAMLASATPYRQGPNPEMQRRFQRNFEQQRELLKDPEYRALMREQQKTGMQRMYGDMEVMLGLSKEEADHVLDVLAEQALRGMEQRPFVSPNGTAPNEAALRDQQRVYSELKQRNDAELAATLGSKYAEWQEYQQSMWSRSQVTRLKETLAASDEPLRQDQIKPLVQAMSQEQQQMQSNGRWSRFPAGGDAEAQMRAQEQWLERTAQSHQRIRDAVSSLLSPAQMQRLEEQQAQERKMQELNLRMQRARAEAAARNGELDPASNAGFIAN